MRERFEGIPEPAAIIYGLNLIESHSQANGAGVLAAVRDQGQGDLFSDPATGDADREHYPILAGSMSFHHADASTAASLAMSSCREAPSPDFMRISMRFFSNQALG